MPETRLLLTFAAMLSLILVLRRGASPARWEEPWRWTEGSALPLLAGLVTALLTTWIWGGLRPEAVWHDEAAYRLQAELFARWLVRLDAVPVPAAFTQAAVLVTPVLTPKMAPGHAILLVPGIWLGLPGLVPVLLVGGTAAMLICLARRLAGPGVALLALVLWTTQGGQQRWRASYLSESTTALCWMVGWWCLLRWREHRDRRWLLLLAAVTGWGAITRPLTMLVFVVPVGVVVLRDCWREKQWRSLALSLILGTAILAVIPLQNRATLGDWRRSPLTLYSEQYLPFDRLGFGLDPTPPTLGLTPDLDQAMAGLRARNAEHLPARLPGILADRLTVLGNSIFGGWRVLLVPATITGLALLPASAWFALGTAILLVVAHLAYAHEPQWSAYYVEAMPVAAFITAAGLAALVRAAGRRRSLSAMAAVGCSAIILAAGGSDLSWARRFRAAGQAPIREFEEEIAAAGIHHGLIFIRYGPGHDPHVSLVRNVADPSSAGVLTVHDLGEETNRLVRQAYPDRQAYRYDGATRQLQPIVGP